MNFKLKAEKLGTTPLKSSDIHKKIKVVYRNISHLQSELIELLQEMSVVMEEYKKFINLMES